MTREGFAERIRWPWIIWATGLINVTAMLPQLWSILKTGDVSSINLGMFYIYLLVQVSFSLHGYFIRDKMLAVCLSLSAAVNIFTISSVYYFR